jgi:predicted nicotinamide N-methyase
MLPFLARVVAKGGRVLVGDPDRGHVPHDWLERVPFRAVQRC